MQAYLIFQLDLGPTQLLHVPNAFTYLVRATAGLFILVFLKMYCWLRWKYCNVSDCFVHLLKLDDGHLPLIVNITQ